MAAGDVLADAGGSIPSWVAKTTATSSNYYVLTNVGGKPTWVRAASVGTSKVLTVSTAHLPTWSPWATISNWISDPWGMSNVGSQVWVADYNLPGFSRLNPDGSTADSAVKNTDHSSRTSCILVVGSTVWVGMGRYISRFNLDGTKSVAGDIQLVNRGVTSLIMVGGIIWGVGSPIDYTYDHIITFSTEGIRGADISPPFMQYYCVGSVMVGGLIWVSNYTNSVIYRLNPDGSRGLPDITGSGLYQPENMAVVGNEVWVANYTSSISRFNFDGTSAGANITGNSLFTCIGICTVGSQVWVSNSVRNSISRFNLDGTIAAPPITQTAS